MTPPLQAQGEVRTLIDELLEEQRDLAAAERFARWHDASANRNQALSSHRLLVPLIAPEPGEQYAFEVDLDRCSGCKSCVTACHALNGLDENETWRSTGLLHGQGRNSFQQTITTACHHCVEPGCLDGCPVLAYDKDPLTGIVRHLDDQCIGCQYCIFMCPYEVPKYSEQRGIVRKCDMCHQRLAHGEAPACVQACPSEAIRITVVKQEELKKEYRDVESANGFLPCSPDPAMTLPTTRYVSAKPLPPNLTAGDAHEARLEPAHVPLVWMLVMTQLGVGGFVMLPFAIRAAQPGLATMALIASLLGLAGSVLHLGQPRKAWRAFLGLRRSWLSREIVGLGVFAVLAVATTVAVYLSSIPVTLFLATAAVGICGVFSSGMTYHVTRRECWRGKLSIGRFFGTTVVLGSAAAWCAAARYDSVVFPIVVVLATLIKLSRELAFLRRCPDDADLDYELPAGLLARSAFMMRFRFGLILRLRLAFGWIGGVVLPLLGLLSLLTPSIAAVAGLFLCLAGEMMERFLFFRAVVVSKMPGSVHA